MVAGSILPIALNEKGELCFLFGKENPMEDSAKGFSDTKIVSLFHNNMLHNIFNTFPF